MTIYPGPDPDPADGDHEDADRATPPEHDTDVEEPAPDEGEPGGAEWYRDELTAPITPSGAVFNPSSARSEGEQPTTPYEQGHPGSSYEQSAPQGPPPPPSRPPYEAPHQPAPLPPYQPAAPPPPSYGPPPGHYPPGPPTPPYATFSPPLPDHPQSTQALIIGVAGLVAGISFCGLGLVASPFAWAIGRNAIREIQASQGRMGGEGMARAGMVMGIVGTVLLILGVLMLMLVAVIVVAGAASSSGSF